MRCDTCENCFTSVFDGMRMCTKLNCVKGSHYIPKDKPKKIEPIRLDKSVHESEKFWRDK